LEGVFPELKSHSVSNETASTDDIPRLKEFLMKVESRMKTLLNLGEKLFKRLSDINSIVTVLNTHLQNIYMEEENFPYKQNVTRQDIRKPVNEWSQFYSRQVELYYDNFYRPLIHEYQDIVAFLELFKYREGIQNKWRKARNRVEKWNDNKNELKEKEEQNKNRDIEEERELSTHLQIVTKIILFNEILVVWKEKTETWRQQILKFAQFYSDISQQLSIGWKSLKI